MSSEFEAVVEDLANKAKHIGLYVISSTVATDNADLVGDDEDMLDKNPDIKAMIENGEASFALMVQFTLGDLAFDTRVQNPTQYEQDMEFRRMMPTEAELHADSIREKLTADPNADPMDVLFGGDFDLPDFGEDEDS